MLTSAALAVVGVGGCAADDGGDGGGYEGDPEVAPEDPAQFQAWLETRGYRAWAQESAPHPSRGPHPRLVKAYVNPALEASLQAGNEHHPAGAVAVKEVYDEDGEKVTGWSMSAKLAETSGEVPDPEAYYWFDVLDDEVRIDEQGTTFCYDCHSAAFQEGQDHVLSNFPLE